MAVVVPTFVMKEEVRSNIVQGTAEERLVRIHFKATSADAADTTDLATYVLGLQGIKGVEMNSLDAADASNDTALNTWSGTTLTYAGHAGSGVWELVILGNY